MYTTYHTTTKLFVPWKYAISDKIIDLYKQTSFDMNEHAAQSSCKTPGKYLHCKRKSVMSPVQRYTQQNVTTSIVLGDSCCSLPLNSLSGKYWCSSCCDFFEWPLSAHWWMCMCVEVRKKPRWRARQMLLSLYWIYGQLWVLVKYMLKGIILKTNLHCQCLGGGGGKEEWQQHLF